MDWSRLHQKNVIAYLDWYLRSNHAACRVSKIKFVLALVFESKNLMVGIDYMYDMMKFSVVNLVVPLILLDQLANVPWNQWIMVIALFLIVQVEV
jgi:hypothetical protein